MNIIPALRIRKRTNSTMGIRYRSASNNHIIVCGKMLLFVRLGYLPVRVRFGIVENLALPVLIGTSYIDQFIKDIFPMKRMILPVHSGAVAILLAYAPTVKSIKSIDIAESSPQLSDPSATLFPVTKQVGIPMNTKMMVPVPTCQARVECFCHTRTH